MLQNPLALQILEVRKALNTLIPCIINLFINSDAILNRDALWSIQGKNHHVNAAIVGGILRTGKVLR